MKSMITYYSNMIDTKFIILIYQYMYRDKSSFEVDRKILNVEMPVPNVNFEIKFYFENYAKL